MRLSEAKIKEAILHPDAELRRVAVEYFSQAFSPNPEVMPLVIESVEKYGRDAVRYSLARADNLAQTEATVDWILGEARQPGRGRDYLLFLQRILLGADLRLTQKRADAILSFLRGKEREEFQESLEFLTWDPERCLEELQRISGEYKDTLGMYDIPVGRAIRLVQAMAPRAEPLRNRILEMLDRDVMKADEDSGVGDPLAWMECFLVDLAGEMRLEAAVPLIVRKLRFEADVLLEDSVNALARIGTPSAAAALADGFAAAGEHYRLFAAGGFGQIHADESVRAALALLPGEEDGGVRTNLGHSLMENFATEGVEVVRQMVLDGNYEEWYIDLRESLVDACRIMGERFPEFDAWEKKVRVGRENSRRSAAAPIRNAEWTTTPPRPAAPSVPKSQRVGRNDPCPCGSGKKFKACCMKKG